jgi:large subunit ribosomal protein L4
MISLSVYDQSGGKTDATYTFDPSELATEVNPRLLHSAVVMYDANRRLGTVKTKSRAEVAGSSKKLYKQKGTGNARMGNKRTPVRRGGGHCFAKRPKHWGYRLPRKALQLATAMAVVGKLRDGEVFLLESLEAAVPKTKKICNLLSRLGVSGKSCLISISQHDPLLWKSCRNIPDVALLPASDLNAASVLRKRFLVLTRDALDSIRKKFAAAT